MEDKPLILFSGIYRCLMMKVKLRNSWLESTLDFYGTKYPARALIQKGFKDQLDANITAKLANNN